MLKHEKISACGVVVLPDEIRMNVAIAFVMANDVTATDITQSKNLIEQLTDLAETELPEHMVPTEIKIIDKMPTTPSGKIDYRELERILDISRSENYA